MSTVWRFLGFDRATECLACEIDPSPATLREAGTMVGIDIESAEAVGAYPIDLDALDVMAGRLIMGSADDVDGCDWVMEQIAERRQ